MKKIKNEDIIRDWHLIDAKNKIVGRLASEVAQILSGKNKAYYTPHLDTGDYVIVVNAKDAKFSAKKETQKKYFRHSGYPGGLYEKTAGQIRIKQPEILIKHAVTGMLPKTRLGKTMVKKLYIYADETHPYKDKFKS